MGVTSKTLIVKRVPKHPSLRNPVRNETHSRLSRKRSFLRRQLPGEKRWRGPLGPSEPLHRANRLRLANRFHGAYALHALERTDLLGRLRRTAARSVREEHRIPVVISDPAVLEPPQVTARIGED